jgi:amino acid adenylation domain-containing protein
MPLGIVAGKAEFMDTFDGGWWEYGDDSYPSKGVTFFAGTFVRHPLALAAAHAMLQYLGDQGPGFWDLLNRRTARLADTLNDFFRNFEIPIELAYFSSQFFVRVREDQKYASLLFYRLREKGVFLLEGFPSYLTAAHSEEDVDQAITAFRESALELVQAGLLSGRLPEGTAIFEESPPVLLPLTEAQREIWVACQLGAAASAAFNESCGLHLRGVLDESGLERAVREVVRRHQALRTVFSEDGAVQRILPALPPRFEVIDLSNLGAEEKSHAVEEARAAEGLRAFDLTTGPLLSVTVLRLDSQEHWVLLTVHHIACDGWSYDILLSELVRLYNGYAKGEPPALATPTPFSDYAGWERVQRHSAEGRASEEWWLQQFASLPEPLDLPADRPRPSQRSFDGRRRSISLPTGLGPELRRLSGQLGVSLYSVLLGGFAVLLHRLSHHRDLVVGIPVAGQNWMGKTCLVGHCANLLPLRIPIDPECLFTELVPLLKRTMLDANEHQGTTFGALVERLNPPRESGRIPLAPVIFNVDPPMDDLAFDGIEAELRINPRRAYQFDLGFNIVEEDGRLAVECDFNTSLFDVGTIDRWLGHYETILTAIVAQPGQAVGQLPLLTGEQRQVLLDEGEGARAEMSGVTCLHRVFEGQVARVPDRVAVVFGDRQWSYRELDRSASALAAYLKGEGVAPGTMVGVHLERSPELIMGILGVLKAGGAYVPIDPAYPQERVSDILDDTGTPVILTHTSLAGRLPSSASRLIPLDLALPEAKSAPAGWREAGPGDLAYVIFTSGSTGRPKGVMIEHRSVVNVVRSIGREPGFGELDVMLAVATASFDISVAEIFLPLTTGGRLVLADRETAMDGARLARLLEASGATFMQPTPITWRLLLEAGWRGTPGLKIISTGEPLPRDLAEQLIHKGECLWNLYGPTETTIWSTGARITSLDGPITIGRPVDNTQLWVVDGSMNLVPPGVPGELLIGGVGVARGYLNRPELTVEKFIPNPFGTAQSGPIYRTGDLARWRSDGSLECLGRLDHQVKIRGYRIELGEIEAGLASFEGVSQAAVGVQPDSEGNQRLVAYVVPRADDPVGLWMSSPTVNGRSVYDDFLFEVMSRDAVRNNCFREAFRRTVQGKILLDVGTGKDAILARLAIEAGARKVYAVEILEEACLQARELVRRLGLEGRIEVLLGDAATVALPEKPDACVAEVIGHIGGAEGLERLLSRCRMQVKPGGWILPGRVLTHAAAVELPDDFRKNPSFTPLAGEYVKRLFEAAGQPYDLRLSIAGLGRDNLCSTSGVFEDCDFSVPTTAAYERELRLQITRKGAVDGLLLWLEIRVTPDDIFDGLEHQKSWLPVFLPVFDPPLAVDEGDLIQAKVTGRPSANGWNKDYVVEGEIVRREGSRHSFRFVSHHEAEGYRETPFYRRLFASAEIPVRAHSSGTPNAAALREGLLAGLPEYMVPSAYVFLDHLPLTPSGKVDRKALPSAGHTTEVAAREFVAPRTEVEARLAGVWQQVLDRPKVGVRDGFFELGGHSLLAVRLFAAIQREFGQSLPLSTLFSAPTIEKLAEHLETENRLVRGPRSSLVPVQPEGRRAPFFCVHGGGGEVLFARDLVKHLGDDFPFFGIEARAFHLSRPADDSVEAMAAFYLREVQAMVKDAPLYLGGYCLGGLVAYEMARQHLAAGGRIGLLVLIDAYNPSAAPNAPLSSGKPASLWAQKIRFQLGNLGRLRPREMAQYFSQRAGSALSRRSKWLLSTVGNRRGPHQGQEASPSFNGVQHEEYATMLWSKYRPTPIETSVVLVAPENRFKGFDDPSMGWNRVVRGDLDVITIPVNPGGMLVEPFVGILGRQLRQRLLAAQNDSVPPSDAPPSVSPIRSFA